MRRPEFVATFERGRMASIGLMWLASHRDRLTTLTVGGKHLFVVVGWDSKGSEAVERDEDEIAAMRRIADGPERRAGWRVHVDGRSPSHVWPVDDVIEHDVVGEDCVCGPEAVLIETNDGDVWQIVHASLDGRELSEPTKEG